MNKSIPNKINGYFQKYKNVFSNTNIRSSNLNTNQDTPQQNEVASHEVANAMRNQVIANSNISINNSNQTIQTNNEGISNQQKLPENEKDLLYFIEDAVCNNKDLDNETIKTLLDNKHLGMISNLEHKNVYLCNLAKTTMQTKKAIKSDTIQILLNNIGNIDDDAKNEYLYNLAIAASKNTINENTLSQLSWTASKTSNLNNATILMLLTNTERINNIDLKNNSLCSIAKAASQTLNLDNDTIQKLLNNIGNIDDDDAKNEYLNNLSKAASQTLNLNDETIKTLISKDNISLIKNKDDYLHNISIAASQTKNLNDETIKTLISKDNISLIKNKDDYLHNISIAASQTKNLNDETIKTLISKDCLEIINNQEYKNSYLYNVLIAASKIQNLDIETIKISLNKIENISSIDKKTKQQNQLAYIYILSENLKINKENNKEKIESLFNKALNYGMFEDDTNTYMQRTFVRNLIDAISRLDQNEAKELYTQLYTTATTTKDNTNPVKENDGKNDIDGYSSENLSNNAQSSYMPPKLILFFAKLDKTLGYQQNTEIQNKLMDAITNTSLDEKENKIKLAPKVSLCPALNYLQEEQLKAIDESAIANRIIQENGAKDIRQFELEYLIDLKLSHGLYELNTDEGRNKFIEILTNNYNYDILTNKFEPKMKYETQTNQVNGDTSNSKAKIKNVKMDNISDENYDGVYNLALIALKQMEPENREEFLNKLIEKLDPKSKTTNLLEELKTNEQFDNDKLLDTKPVLRQYDDKSKTVSKNYQPNLTSFRMPRTTDKCEIFKENGTTYLGFKGTSQKIETKLDTKKAELLFGSQSSSGHQMIGNCWLIATLKQIEANPQLKLAVYSHFDATVDKNNELQSVTINLKDGRKVTFSKDVVDEVSKIGATEHLSPAMSCLALLSAIYRTTGKNGKHDISQINETINSSSLQEKFSESQYDTDSFDNVNESNKQITAKDPKNAIINALRISNEDGNEFNDILSLFIDDKQDNIKDDTQSNGVNTIQVIGLYKHAIGKYGDFYLNPQNSHSLSIFSKATDEDQKKAAPENSDQQKEIYVNKIYKKDDQSYTIPQFKAETIYSKIKKSVNNIVNSFIGFFKKDNTKTNLSVNG